MFRITAKQEDPRRKVLYLEGKICRDCVREIEFEVEKSLAGGGEVVLDFSKVTFLNDEAARSLRHFPSDNVHRRNCSLFIKSLLEFREKKRSTGG